MEFHHAGRELPTVEALNIAFLGSRDFLAIPKIKKAPVLSGARGIYSLIIKVVEAPWF